MATVARRELDYAVTFPLVAAAVTGTTVWQQNYHRRWHGHCCSPRARLRSDVPVGRCGSDWDNGFGVN